MVLETDQDYGDTRSYLDGASEQEIDEVKFVAPSPLHRLWED